MIKLHEIQQALEALGIVKKLDILSNLVGSRGQQSIVNAVVSTFISLSDTPNSYVGEGGKVLAVKADETGIEFVVGGAGAGDVVGPAVAVDNNIAVFDGITGKLIKDGGKTIAAIEALIPTVSDVAYDPTTWNANLDAASKNAIRDKFVVNDAAIALNTTHRGIVTGNPHNVTLSDVGGTTDHTALSNIGVNTHAQIDTHISDATIHFTEASIDHGSIAGLGDDDHTQYALVDGSRAFSGVIGGVTPTLSTHLATKGYVDALVSGIVWQEPVLDKDLTAPPGGPGTGDRYIVAAGATGAWSGQDDDIAEYNGVTWDFETPAEGFATWVEDEDKLYVFVTAWQIFGSVIDHGNLIGLADDDHVQYLLIDGSRAMTGSLDMDDNAITNVNYIDFDLINGVAPAEGRLVWNPTEGTANLGMPGGVVNLQIGQEMLIRATNDQGAQIDNGNLVRISGGTGNFPDIKLADKSSIATAGTIGIATEDIVDGQKGFITNFGLVRDVDTDGMAAGSLLWLGDDGAYTTTVPTAPDIKVVAGVVIREHISEGIIFAAIQQVPRLRGLSDVHSPTTPNDNEIIYWDDANSRFAIGGHITEQFNYWNGSFLETHQLSVTSDGATIKATLEKSGTGDLTMRFSNGGGSYDTLDCTPIQELTISAGTDTAPVLHYIYILKSTLTLASSIVEWPSEEHIRVGTIVVRSATFVQASGALVSRWNDHSGLTSDGRGHSLHIAERLRQFFGEWDNGVESSISIVSVSDPDDVYLSVTSGEVYQLHKQSFASMDMSVGDEAFVQNHPTTPFVGTSNLNDQLVDATGASLSGRYFTFVVWGVNSSGSETDAVLINLPTGSYSNITTAIADTLGYNVYTIPKAFKNTGFLIGQYTFKHSTAASGTWTQENYVDLRGKVPNATAGSATGSSGITTFLGLTDTPLSYTGEAGKVAVINVGETTLEFIEALTEAEVTDLTDAGDSALHYHATDRARANHTGTQTASTISDFDTEVSNNTDVAANTAARHTILTVNDTAEIDLTLVGQLLTADIVASSIDETKLDASVNASLDLADSATQPGDLATVATSGDHADLSNIGTNTHVQIDTHIADSTIHFTQASISITASQVSDFDTEVANNSAVAANTAKVTNATHTGEVTGSGALTVADNIIDEANLKLDTGPTNDYVLTADSTKSGGMKWAVASGAGDVATDAIWDAKGDLAVGTGANTAQKLTVGSNGQLLTADSSETTGLKWVNSYEHIIVGETPTGTVDGSNAAFDTANSYISGKIEVYRDGQLMKSGGADYTETDSDTITFTTAPITGSVILINYLKGGVAIGDADTLDGQEGAYYAVATELADGWIDAGETWTYASSDDPTYTFTISSFDATTKYQPGMRIKLTDSGTQYFIITKVVFDDPGSTITAYGGTDYNLSTGAITNPFYSSMKSPLGFPLDPLKWTIETEDSSNRQQSSPTSNVWYNLGSLSIDIPVGSWDVVFKVIGEHRRTGTGTGIGRITLSTANNSESDVDFTQSMFFQDGSSDSKVQMIPFFSRKSILLSAKTTHYLNMKTDSGSSIRFRGDYGTTTIRAVSAYL